MSSKIYDDNLEKRWGYLKMLKAKRPNIKLHFVLKTPAYQIFYILGRILTNSEF